MRPKVFGIGFHKTGTTSLKKALEILGYRVTGPNGVKDPEIARNVMTMAFDLVDQFDAFQDNPWPIIYRELDQKYPDSKFILTVRDVESWILSQVRHFGRRETPMRKWIYGVGCPEGNEAIYRERFETHNRDVLQYFSNSPGKLLVLDITGGDGWEELCPFLDAEIPAASFPHANTAVNREQRSSAAKGPRSLVRRVVKRLWS